ncbi:MAG: hypothetical protein IJ789_00520 [Bacteroidales bacterium]|nr:hypothetical protein [Bacteroidales bacterium]
MKKKVLLIASAMLMVANVKAQTTGEMLAENVENTTLSSISYCETDGLETYSLMPARGYNSFTRGQGFVIRPELYRGFFASFGYQINTYVQTFLSVGYGDGLESALGVRSYTGDANWVAMFDLRFSLTNFVLPGVSLVAGASYKDLDFGAGLKYYTDGYYYLIMPVVSVGWNIRL